MPQPEKLDEKSTDATGSKNSFARGARGSTGPRTVPGKQRSRYNAIKRGIFAKFVLLEHESAADYESVLNGLREDFHPEGTLETLLVENLAAIIWRKRRFLQAEAAEIANGLEFKSLESIQAQDRERWDRLRSGESLGGMLRDWSNPLVVDEAIEILTLLRTIFEKFGFYKDEDSWLLRKLYGLDHDDAAALSLFRTYKIYSKLATRAPKENDDRPSPDELKNEMLGFFDAEISRLKVLKELGEEVDKRKREHQKIAAQVPSQPVMDRLIRYENHLSREFDRTLNQLERLQRIRRGQPVPPSLRVELSG
ncbi:MAG TPA: hypothetical protein VOA88_23290 [Candidatus Dormibacteraeota bacterium]|nr:hypothetical protein [Candidatus Dormibacteraeota bacterium]